MKMVIISIIDNMYFKSIFKSLKLKVGREKLFKKALKKPQQPKAIAVFSLKALIFID